MRTRFQKYLRGLREGHAEVQEYGWGQEPGRDISVVDHLVEAVQFPGVVETEIDEGGQAKNIEVLRLVGAAAAEVYEQPDDQVGEADHVLVDHRPIERHLTDNQSLNGYPHAAADDGVVGFVPEADSGQYLGYLDSLPDRAAADFREAVAFVDAGFRSRAPVRNAQGGDTVSPVSPNHSILWEPEPVLLFEIDDGRHGRSDR